MHFILLLMIKNESRIIDRCLHYALPHVDAIFILDTGSTDDTISKCTHILKNAKKPFEIITEPFTHFGKNRTLSFQRAQTFVESLGWNKDTTYAITIDADMILVPSPAWKTYPLTHPGYRIMQTTDHLSYMNTRILQCSYDWKCIGATHEYWNGDPVENIPSEIIYIDDRNDGGCKADKLERDIRLLTEELKEEPTNARAHFYLARSLQDTCRTKDAIQMYQKRIEMKGWREEVWYSYYQIAKCYEQLRDIHNMERWANEAFTYHPIRAEPMYYVTQYFRKTSQHYKAYHYYLKGKNIPYPKKDILFIEHEVYQGLFEFEYTILAYYVTQQTKQDGLLSIISYLNRNVPHHVQTVWDNLQFYTEPLLSPTYRGKQIPFSIPSQDHFTPSSCSLLSYSDDANQRYLMNIRYVNYWIDKKGKYHTRGSLSEKIQTRNGYLFLNESYEPTTEVVMMEEDYPHFPSQIEGLEDIRLIRHNGLLKCMASCKNIIEEDRMVMVHGDYDLTMNQIHNLCVLPYQHKPCEKNWIYVEETHLEHTPHSKGKFNVIYQWSPMEIGAITDEGLTIHTVYPTPTFFQHMRGSSPLVEYENKIYTVTHLVQYSEPRCYYHSVVQCNKNTMQPEMYSAPFTFCASAIEYCIGFDIKGGIACFLISQNDANPSRIMLPLDHLRMIPVRA
jgi:glycosyltransferase involved in cell wall biosynthesis